MKIFIKTLFLPLAFILASSFSLINNKVLNEKSQKSHALCNDSAFMDAMLPIDVQSISVKGEMGRRIDSTINNNLLKLNLKEDFLAFFHERDKTGGYLGIGKLIDASVRFAYYSKNPKVLGFKRFLIDELIKGQEKDGYIGICKKDVRMWALWDVHEMAYIIFGLVSDYKYFNEQRSLNSAVDLTNYIIRNWSDEMPKRWMKQNISEHLVETGLDRAILSLYVQTENPEYLDFLTDELALPAWNLNIVLGRKKKVEGHVYTYITRCLAQLELYRIHQDERLLRTARRALEFLTQQDGMLVTGEVGQWECWTNDQDGAHALGETCATAYLIRFYEKLFRVKGDSKFGDLMERTIYNALFAAQSPEGRHIRYYTPIEGQREYFEKDIYCCPNNFRRIIAELPSMIYYQYNNGFAINLYTESEAKINLSSDNLVLVKQVTDYPSSGIIKIIVSPENHASFPILLRIPVWAAEAQVSVNNKIAVSAEPGMMFRIERDWSKNDTIKIELPMKWRFIKGRQRQAGRIAIMRGPIIYCLNPRLNKGIGIEEKNGYELGRIIIDPKSIKGPLTDETIRCNGTKLLINAWEEGSGLGEKYNYSLTLSEFVDPEGKAIYFNSRDPEMGVYDDLCKSIPFPF